MSDHWNLNESNKTCLRQLRLFVERDKGDCLDVAEEIMILTFFYYIGIQYLGTVFLIITS